MKIVIFPNSFEDLVRDDATCMKNSVSYNDKKRKEKEKIK